MATTLTAYVWRNRSNLFIRNMRMKNWKMTLVCDQNWDLPSKYLYFSIYSNILPRYIRKKGLIELPEQLKAHPFVQPIKLPTACDAIGKDVNVTTMGKGSSSLEKSESDNRLRYEHMLTYSSDECWDSIKKDRAHFDRNSVICTRSVLLEQFLLTGDSGMLSSEIGTMAPACQRSCAGWVSHAVKWVDWVDRRAIVV